MIDAQRPKGSATRILHFSDIHIDVPWTRLAAPNWHLKRWVGAANLMVRRARHFQSGRQRLSALNEWMRQHDVDAVLCSGDYTTLGTALEMQEAWSAVQPLTHSPLGYVTVPGNHDLYLHDSVEAKHFEHYFGPFLGSDLPEHQVDTHWPLVRWVGEHVVVIAVNSARPNPEPWRSSGRIPSEQLRALRQLLSLPSIQQRFVFVMTHYAPFRKDATPDTTLHGLENASEFLEVCRAIRAGAIVHGHIHWAYHVRPCDLSIPIFCAGSATHHGREACWVYDVNPREPDQSVARLLQWNGSHWYQADHEVPFQLNNP
jgi:3',5'-cyclic AMP phosphodiesterase CpdA